jgi:sugar phosphate isomerase/epimerase
MNRRDFLVQAAIGGAGMVSPVLAGSLRANRLRRPLGLCLDMLRREIQHNHWDTLEVLQKLGFSELEFSETLDMAPVDFRLALRDFKLAPVAGGGTMRAFQNQFGHLVDQAHFFGRSYLVCYWPWPDDAEDPDADQYYAAAGIFNRFGARCRSEGLRFAFLAGQQEYRFLDPAVRGIDILLNNTDPGLVACYLQLYWSVWAGVDPVAYFRRYPGRFELCRLVDLGSSPDRSPVALGDGVIDFRSILQHGQHAGIRHYFVDQDNAGDPVRTLKKAAAHLHNLKF